MFAQIVFGVTILIRVVLVFKTSACLRNNEEFSLCGWKCPPTCINLRLLSRSERPCPLLWECGVGCRCSAGYVRDEYSKHCVTVHDCPVWACVCASILRISAVSSAPIAEDGEQNAGYTDPGHMDYLRGKRLNNNVYTVIPPCAAAAAAAANLAAARTPEAFTNFAPEARYYMPNAYDIANSGYAENMYRMEDPYSDNREMMRYSDTNFVQDQIPAARYASRTAPASYGSSYSGGLNSQYNSPGYSGPAYGIFPNANTKPCNVPLLFTCSPSVVTGHMVRSDAHGYASPISISSGIPGLSSHPEAYRGVDELNVQRIHANQEQAMNVNLTPANKVTAAHSNEKST